MLTSTKGLLLLPLAELEALARPRLTVLLAYLLARVAGEQARRLQPLAQLVVEPKEGARDAMADGAGLARRAAAFHGHLDVEFLRRLGQQQRLLDDHPQDVVGEVAVEGLAVDRDVAAPGAQEDPRRRGLAPAGAVVAELAQFDSSPYVLKPASRSPAAAGASAPGAGARRRRRP